jgi:hypothetical protein
MEQLNLSFGTRPLPMTEQRFTVTRPYRKRKFELLGRQLRFIYPIIIRRI